MANFLAFAIIVSVACLMLTSGFAKLRSGDIISTVVNYEILPLAMIRVVAPALPYVEIILGAMLLGGVELRLALPAASALLVISRLG